jgi:hypothetical protein
LALTPSTPPSGKLIGSDEAFLREVDDAVRAGDLQGFWKRFGRWLVAALVIGIAAFGGWIMYQRNEQSKNEALSETYVAAIDKLNSGAPDKEKLALAELAKIAKADQPGYRAMAQMLIANAASKNGDVKKAAADYTRISADNSFPQEIRDMALIRKTLMEADTLQPQQLIDRMKPFSVPGNPFFGTAGELTAISYMKLGKDDLAGAIFVQLAKQKDLPESLRSRATQMAGSMGFDVVQPDENKDNASGAVNVPSKGEAK